MVRSRTIRVDDKILTAVDALAAERGCSANQVIEEALKLYRDLDFTQNNATFLNEAVLRVIQAGQERLKEDINRKTNQLLSELAIQVCILNLVIGLNLQIPAGQLDSYRIAAVEHLKTKQRILRLDEVVD